MDDIILVTGASGNVSSKLVSMLAGTGNAVRAAVRKPSESLDLKRNNVELVEFDFSNPQTFESAFKGVTKLFLLTPFSPNMVELTQLVIDYAKKAGLKQVVKLSAMGAGSSDLVPFKWHYDAEQLIQHTGFPFTILRPNFFMQNFVNFSAPTIKTQNAFYQPTGKAKASFVDTRDIAEAAAVVLTKSSHSNRIYQLTGPEAISNYEAAEILSKAVGREINFVDVPEEAARGALTQSGMPETIVNALMNLNENMKNGQMSEVSPTLEWILGRKPTTFTQFTQEYADKFKQENKLATK